LKPLRRLQRTGTPAEDARAIDQHVDASRATAPFQSGVRIDEISLNGSTQVAHKLGRKPRGWIVLDVTDDEATFYRESWDETHVTFQAPNACIASIWFF
jgi:hypothetical protein